MKAFDVFFQGKMSVQADTEAEATDNAYELLKNLDADAFEITSTEEVE